MYIPKYIVLISTAGPDLNVKMGIAAAQEMSNIIANSPWHFKGALRHGTRRHEVTPERSPLQMLKMTLEQPYSSSFPHDAVCNWEHPAIMTRKPDVAKSIH
mmetsp:Transcript_8394/g.18105  ORF Transcript_8394/g.18105 Transcript_8394/m.18105 type:complete len:101 (-) Transcript_8394:874-1176(-)